MIDRVEWGTGNTAGGAGVSTANANSPHVAGKILAVYVKYNGSPPGATTDFTLKDANDPGAESIVTLVDTATSQKLYPRRVTEKNDGTDILYVAGEEVHEPYVVHGPLTATIAQANDDDSATVTVWVET